jgi:hypothetical protein
MNLHAIAKDQYPRYRGPNGAEAFDKGLFWGDTNLARAK